MITYQTLKCKDCGTTLWSSHAKELCLCPDCEIVDSDVIRDLEERLNDVFN